MRSTGARPGLGPRRLARGVFTAAWLVLALAPPGSAQPPAEPTTPEGAGASPAATTPPAPPAKPVPIPLSEVALAAERASASLAEIVRSLAADARVAEIEAELPQRREQLAADARQVRADIAAGRSLRSLAAIELLWRGHGEALLGWVALLGKRADEVQALRQRLAVLEETWQATLELARQEQAPGELLERIRSTLSAVEGARARAQERAAALLTLQGAAADLSREADAVVEELRARRATVEGELLEAEQPPLWRALTGPGRLGEVLEQGRASFARDLGQLREFEGLGRHLLSYAVLLGLALPLTYALRGRSVVRRREGRSLGAADWVFDYPISLAVLATLPLSWWWLFPGIPTGVLRLFLLLVWIPVVRVLRRLVPEDLHAALYALAVFFVIDRLRDVLEPAPAAERTVFALEIAAATVLLVRLLRPRRLEDVPAGMALPRGVGIAMRLAVVALVTALLANVLGYVDLSRLVGETLLGGAYLAVLLYAVMRVLRLVALGLLRTPPARRLRVVQRHGEQIQRRFARVVGWLAAALWLWVALRFLGVRDTVVAVVRGLFEARARVGSLDLSLGDVAAFAVTLWLSLWASRILRSVLEDEVFPRASLGRGVPHAISAVAQYSVLGIGFLLAAGAAGFDWSRITLLAGAFGVGIGFGLQNVVNNFVSGLILLFERPVQVGDIVQQGQLIGEVRRIGIRSSTIRTAEGAEVIVPNADLISQQVVNWTLSDRNRRIDLPVGVAYGTPPERVLALLDQLGRAHPDTLADPEPMALFRGFGESSLDFELRIWTARPERMLATRSELAVAIHDALAAAGIEVPFPQRDLRLVAVADEAAAALAGAGSAQAAAPGSPSPEKR